jgi:hypothetical protein
MSAGPSRHSAITCQSNIYLALHISPFVGRAQHADEVFGSDRPTKRVLALRAYQKPRAEPAARLLILQRF